MAPVSGVGTDPHIELSQAAQCGDYSTLDTILSFGKVEIRRPGPNGLSLMLLIVHGAGRDLKPAQHLQCAKRLIKAGAPLDEVDRTGRCALHWAVEYDKPELLEVMLRSGASKTILDEEMKEPLDIAVELSNIKCISIILRSCSKEELDSPNEEGFTWLMRAAASGNMEVCRELYNAGASPNIIEPKTGRTALHFCAEFDQAQSLITLLGCEGDPKIRDKDGRTVAHVAAESEAIGCLHVLIEACTLLIMEVADDSGKTPLMLACRHEHEQTVKALISKNINPMAKDYNGQTALHWCAKNTNGKCAKILCKYRIDLTKAKDNDSHTPLHLACIAGSEEVVNKLLEFGADTTTMDDEFHTPLHLATVSGNAGCIVLLAQSGADVNVTDANGAYPLHYAANMSRDIEKLPEDAPVPTPSGDKATSDLLFIDPSLRNRPREDAQKALESLLALLENGASVVVRDSSGAQPLFNAAREGNEAACRLLLDFEADVAAKDNHGRTALHVAAQEGHGDVLTTLLEVQNMACLDAVDDRGRTPLMYAAASGKTKCVELLLEASANPNHKDDKQISVAHCLASVGDVEGMKLLKAKSGNLSTASKSGTYPLHEAALAGKPDVMSYLVKQGVVMGVRDSSGITPLHCSIANDNPECCKILVENGDNINPVMRTKDMRYLTPLDYALINVRPNCAEYLAKNNALPGIIYTGVMVNRIRLAWRRFRRRKYGRSRPETPHTGNTPALTAEEKELSNIEKVHDLRLRLEQELQRTKMEEEMGHVSRARVSQEVETLARQSTRYRDELKSSLHNTENMYRNVDQYIGQAMEVNNDLEDFLSQASRGKKASRGHRVTGDNFKSFRQAKTYNTSMVQETSSNKDKMYFKRSVDKSIRSNRKDTLSAERASQTSLDGKEYLFTANRRLQTYEEWMMLKWQEMKEKSLQTVRWTPVRVEPPQNIDLTAPPPAKDVKILYREYDQSSGRINKVVATNPDGAKIEFRADPPSDGENKQVRKKSPYKSKARIVDPETAAAYKLPSYNFGGYDGQPSNYNRKPLKFHHPPSKTKKSRVIA
ncbi:serine/threonine-protein phosphatase 6 regulatory ankyrin repeat subunit B-like isoform X11 [Bolinopsis microptera]|uniref:serine/threonine-protein phosphatase 6 regulatory ankyrin repeat subunit B-like isoform X11 n=1 Tax=Bolinopsis microptera TaxID=2820187 RepID=UPI003078ED4D